MKADVYNDKAEKVGSIDLPERIFSRPWNADLVHQAVRTQMSNRRENIAHAKGRGEVRGGGKKPWRQKGTGRARHGSIRSPLWKGGGVTHGPLKEKNYSMKMNKKMRQAALFSILSRRLKDGEIKIVESMSIAEPKTKLLKEVLVKFGDGRLSFLVVPGRDNKNIYRASRNLFKVKSLDPHSLNAYDLLKHKQILFEKSAVEELEKHYNATK